MSITILLADDHRLVRECLRDLLVRQEDIDVVAEAENGVEAVRLARELAPDVAVVDISMPDLNGVEATRRMLSEGSGTKVLALSMHSRKLYIVEMLKAGASGYLLKDCAFEELVDAVRTVAAGGTYLSPAIAGLVSEDPADPPPSEA
jgi:DNA-binding NarL/FixJ family response regulator